MTSHKSEDHKVSAVNYYLTEDTNQEEVCKIFNIYHILIYTKLFVSHLFLYY